MKIALFVMKEQRIILDNMYDSIAENFQSCDIYRLTSQQQTQLKLFFQQIDLLKYDRIVLMLRFKKLLKQVATLRMIEKLVFIDHDTCQDFFQGKYQGKFSAFYQKIPWATLIMSGCVHTQVFKKKNINAFYAPKGYDPHLIYNLNQKRDIEVAFIGSIKNTIYKKREYFLQTLQKKINIKIIKTQSGDQYQQMLNRVHFFISADIEMGEYMIKNYEAMAAGCVVFAWRQGKEDECQNFKHMENIVLYSTQEELLYYLSVLKSTPDLAKKIAKNGQQFVKQYTWQQSAKKIAKAIHQPLRKRVVKRFLGFSWYHYQ